MTRRARISVLTSVTLISLAGLWLWFAAYTQSTIAPPPRYILQQEQGLMSWTHYDAEGNATQIVLRRSDYPTLAEYHEDVAWHEKRYPKNSPPSGD